jgi:glycosyltransferase involved in cell wall biosynthesis
MVLAEALFSALPVVAYDMGGVSDAVFDGLNGYLVPAEDLESFKGKVLNIITDKDLREKLGGGALRFAYDNLTLDHMLEKYEKVIAEVTA